MAKRSDAVEEGRMVRRNIGIVATVVLAACPQPRHGDIESRLAALEMGNEQAHEAISAIDGQLATLDGALTTLTEAVADNRAAVEVNTLALSDQQSLLTDSGTRIRMVEEELNGGLLGWEGSRLDIMHNHAVALETQLGQVDDELRGTADAIVSSRLDLLEQATSTDVLNARLTELETAGFVTMAQLVDASFASQQDLDLLGSFVDTLAERLPSSSDCADGDVLVYDAQADWFDCASATSVGRVVGVTTHTNGRTRDVRPAPAVIELERFVVEKRSATSSLIVHGSMSVAGPGGPATVSWQYGTGDEVVAQLSDGAELSGSSLSTTTVLDGPHPMGAAELVLRTRSQGDSPAPPFLFYNPDNRENGNITANASTYVVWEVELGD